MWEDEAVDRVTPSFVNKMKLANRVEIEKNLTFTSTTNAVLFLCDFLP
jgi:hypothetical protein